MEKLNSQPKEVYVPKKGLFDKILLLYDLDNVPDNLYEHYF